jgi:Trk-type K+ transport system membrane component
VTTEPTGTQKPAMTPEERRRRKARRAWIPTLVIAGVIVVAIAAAVVFQLSGAGKIVAPPPGDSKFNIAGLRVIHGAADAQIDVRGPLTAKSVGLPAYSSKTFGPFDDIQLQVDLVGTHGTESIFVDSMHVITRHGLVTSISTSTTDFGYLFIRSQISSLGVLGLTTKQMALFEDSMPNGAGDANSHFNLPFGTGNALGIPTTVRVSCAGAKGCTVSTNTTLKLK